MCKLGSHLKLNMDGDDSSTCGLGLQATIEARRHNELLPWFALPKTCATVKVIEETSDSNGPEVSGTFALFLFQHGNRDVTPWLRPVSLTFFNLCEDDDDPFPHCLARRSNSKTRQPSVPGETFFLLSFKV